MAHVAIMIRIIPSENRNMYFRMIQDSDTTFKVEMGRVGAAPYVRYYPLCKITAYSKKNTVP